MFKRILIANRGEIACRIIKTARRMGIETVAVYSEADRDALHVEMADEAVLIGPPAAAQSYLLIDKIVEACRTTGAEAVHPGYGFLSEREAFPVALAKAGVVFIGPNPKAIAAMGDKIESKKAAAKAKVSTVPGHLGVIEDDKHAVKIAERDRLSGDDQGLRRRRRQGHAHRAFRQRGRRGLRALEIRGEILVRRRPHVHREVHRQSAPHRDPGAGRQARQRHLSRRARMLDPAPQSEGDRGGAVAVARRGDAQKDGRAGGRAGQGRRLRQRRHRRVRRRPGQELLFPRDEHAAPGRASGDRTRHRHRSGRADDPRRRGREADARAEGREAQRLGGREPRLCRGPVPQLPALDRAADALSPAGGGEPRRRHGAQRHRRHRRRRNLDPLRSDDRQARHPRADARRRDRRAVERARRLRHRRHPPQHSVSFGADAACALAGGPALDRLHRRGVSRRLPSDCARPARWPRRSPRSPPRSITCWASASAASPAR